MKKLFHAVVVVGAALTATGCGDDEAGSQKDAAVTVADASTSADAAVTDAGPPDARRDGMVIIL